MRIEQQGYIEVQPPYQHVGYTVAAVQGVYLGTRIQGLSFGLLGLGLVLLAAALLAARRLRTSPTSVIAVAALTGGALLVGCLGLTNARRVQTLQPAYYLTLRNVEEACALTESWAAELGRFPTEAEWNARIEGRSCALDGWGRSLTYAALPSPAPGRDGQLYVVRSGGRAGDPEDYFGWSVASAEFGPDGVFGTPDDRSHVRDGRGDWTDWSRYEHGRTPRGATP